MVIGGPIAYRYYLADSDGVPLTDVDGSRFLDQPYQSEIDVTDRVISGSIDLGDVSAVGSSHAGIDAPVAVLSLTLAATDKEPDSVLRSYAPVDVLGGFAEDTTLTNIFSGLLGDEIRVTTTATGAQVQLRARDHAKALQDMFISDWPILADGAEPEWPHSIVDVLEEIAALLPAAHRKDVITTGGGVNFSVHEPYRPQNASLWDAAQQLAIQAGALLVANSGALVLSMPPRFIVPDTADHVFDGDHVYVDDLSQSDTDLRNVVTVVWTDAETRERRTTEARDQWSIDNLTGGIEKRSVLTLDATSQIGTESQAENLAERFIHDMSREFATTRLTLPFTPSMKLFDLIEVRNPRTSDQPRYFFAHSIRHSWRGSKFRTSVSGVSRVVGKRRAWLDLEPRPGSPNDPRGAHRSVLPPPLVNAYSANPGFTVYVSPARGVDSKVVEVYWSTTSGFTPGPANLVAVGAQERWTFNNRTDTGAPDYVSAGLHYIRVRSVDSQGNPGEFSAQVSVSPGGII